MIGEPLSAIYADAGTWGVFDTSARRDLVDVAVSAVALGIIVCLVLVWARESAAAWTPVARGPQHPAGPMAPAAVIVVPCVVTIAVRQALAATALLTSFITAASAAFLVLPVLFFSYCGTAAYSCATQEPHDLLAAYGLLAAFTTVYAAIATLITLALAFAVGGISRRPTQADSAIRRRRPRHREGRPAVREPDRAAGRARRSRCSSSSSSRPTPWPACTCSTRLSLPRRRLP